MAPVIAVMAVALMSCPYDNTLLNATRTLAAGCVDQNPGETPTLCGTITRQYDFVCGNIMLELWKDASDPKPNFGTIKWDLPATTTYPTNGCHLDSRGNSCCWANTFTFRGLDKNTGSGRGGVADGVVRWRKETCSQPGYREGKQGHVKRCDPSRVHTYIELTPAISAALETGDDIDDPE
jgi:hypothetical protein